MSMTITSRGTYGAAMPRLPGALQRIMTEMMFRIMRNRRMLGFRVLMLTTLGARSGRKRRSIVGYFDDEKDPRAYVIVGSAAGSASHPAWFFNLAKHPDEVWIEVGTSRLKVTPEVLAGDERERAWQRVVAEASNYAAYPNKTDREIPLIRLRPVAD